MGWFTYVDMERNSGYEEGLEKGLDTILRYFTDTPCNYGEMEKHAEEDWCCEHCGTVTTKECWLHAIKEGWTEENER